MSYDNILTNAEGSIKTIFLNQPKTGNALDTPMLEDLTDAITHADESDRIDVALLQAKGDVFVAGSDIEEMKEMGPISYLGYLDSFNGLMDTIREVDIPVIAGVNGPAFGGGNILVAATDMAIAGESSLFGQQEINVGIMGGIDFTDELPRKVVNELVMLGEPFSAERARDLGLVNKVVADDSVDQTARDWARKIASKPQVALGLAKRSIRAASDGGPVATEAIQTFALSLCFDTDDQVEGMEAFLDQREPEFSDRLE